MRTQGSGSRVATAAIFIIFLQTKGPGMTRDNLKTYVIPIEYQWCFIFKTNILNVGFHFAVS